MTRLVCPRCRRPEEGKLVVHELSEAPAGLSCWACLAVYPVVDEVPIVLRDVDGWLAQQAPGVLARTDLPPAVLERVLQGAGPELRRDAQLLEIYEQPQGSLIEQVRERVAALEGEILDLGCGRGLHGREDVVGLDLRFAMARAFAGRGIVGDAADPPFLAHAFDAVLLLNLLDSCPDPRMVLGQADALLRPGGVLLIATPWAWQDGITPPGQRCTGEELRACLEGEQTRLELELSYRVDAEEEHTWVLRPTPRTRHEHTCQLIAAIKT